MFLFVVVLPSPTVIYFRRGSESASVDGESNTGAEILEEVQDNPLATKEEPVEADADAAVVVEVSTTAAKVREILGCELDGV